MSEHLHNAARVWETMLAELHPEHQWVVSVGEDEAADRQRPTATRAPLDQAGRSAGDRSALTERGGHKLNRAA